MKPLIAVLTLGVQTAVALPSSIDSRAKRLQQEQMAIEEEELALKQGEIALRKRKLALEMSELSVTHADALAGDALGTASDAAQPSAAASSFDKWPVVEGGDTAGIINPTLTGGKQEHAMHALVTDEECQQVQEQCKREETAKQCYRRLNTEEGGPYAHPDKGGTTDNNQILNGCYNKQTNEWNAPQDRRAPPATAPAAAPAAAPAVAPAAAPADACMGPANQVSCCVNQCAWVGSDGGKRPCQVKAKLEQGTTNLCSDKDMSVNPDDVAGKQLDAKLNQITGSLQVGNLESGSSVTTTPAKLAEMKPVPGSDYLGVGYDVYSGNPDGDNKYMLDPGFRLPIRAMAYKPDWLTRDGRYQVPQGAVALPELACTRSEDYSNIASSSDYAMSMAKDVSVAGGLSVLGIGGGAFSSSVGWSKSKNEARQDSFYKFTSKSYCLKFSFQWLDAIPKAADLMPQFVEAALIAFRALEGNDPKNLNPSDPRLTGATKKWHHLFNTFGTHYITKLQTGGKVIYTRYVDKTSAKSQQTIGRTTSTGQGGNANIEAISVKSKMSVSTAFNSMSGSESAEEFGGSQINIMGGIPSGTGDASTLSGFAAWANTVVDNPMPVKYDIGPLSDFAIPVLTFLKKSDKSVADDNLPAIAPTSAFRSCDSQCYTAGTNTSNGVLTISSLNLTWAQKCKWTTPYCGGCLECNTGPFGPASPPPSHEESSKAPPAPSSPPSAQSLLSPAPENLFTSAYNFFCLSYAEVGKQRPNKDDTDQVLRLGGGACADDPTRGSVVEVTSMWNNDTQSYPPDDWATRSNDFLEDQCEGQCLGLPGQQWRVISYWHFTYVFGTDAKPAGKLNCPQIAAILLFDRGCADWAHDPNGGLKDDMVCQTVFQPTDPAIQNCPGISYNSWLDTPPCIMSKDGLKQQTKGKTAAENCAFRFNQADCKAQDWCQWAPDQEANGKDFRYKFFFVPVRQSENVAAQFYPGNQHLPDPTEADRNKSMTCQLAHGTERCHANVHMAPPRCDCVQKCPKVEYTAASLDRYSSEYGRHVAVQCSDETSLACDVQSYMPWPKEPQAPSTAYTMVGTGGSDGMCSSAAGGQSSFKYSVLWDSESANEADPANNSGVYSQFIQKCEELCNIDRHCKAYDFSYYTDQEGAVNPASMISQTAAWQLGCRLYTTNVQAHAGENPNFPTCIGDAPYFCFTSGTYFTSECPPTPAVHQSHATTLASSVLAQQATVNKCIGGSTCEGHGCPDSGPCDVPGDCTGVDCNQYVECPDNYYCTTTPTGTPPDNSICRNSCQIYPSPSPPPSKPINQPPSPPPAPPPPAPPPSPGGCVSTYAWKQRNNCGETWPAPSCPDADCPQIEAAAKLKGISVANACNAEPHCQWLTYSPPSPASPPPLPSMPYDPPCDVVLSLKGAPTYPAQTTMSTPTHWIKWSAANSMGQVSNTVKVHNWNQVYTQCYMRLMA